jgi:hypothetical protein
MSHPQINGHEKEAAGTALSDDLRKRVAESTAMQPKVRITAAAPFGAYFEICFHSL